MGTADDFEGHIQQLKQQARRLADQARAAAKEAGPGSTTRVRSAGGKNIAIATSTGGGTSGAFSIQTGDTTQQGILTDDGWVVNEHRSAPDKP